MEFSFFIIFHDICRFRETYFFVLLFFMYHMKLVTRDQDCISEFSIVFVVYSIV
jgi:hypothetical protein